MYYQYELSQDGGLRMTAWLGRRLLVGTRLTLKKPQNVAGSAPAGWWRVEQAHRCSLDFPPDVSWKVGGMQ